MSQQSAILALQCEFLCSERAILNIQQPSGCEKTQAAPLSTPHGKNWPQEAEMHMTGMISTSPDSCLLWVLLHRKALKSLTWDIWFSLINNNLLMFRWLTPCCKLLYNLIPFPTSSEHFSKGQLRCCLRACSPKNSHQIKHISQLSGFDYFLKSTHAFFLLVIWMS